MFNRLAFVFPLFLIFSPLFAQKIDKTGPVDISDALKQKWIELRIESKGGFSGETLKLHCTNLKGKFFNLHIPQGQLMLPADSGMQTLVVAMEQSLAVQIKKPLEVVLKTFCTEAGDRGPTAGTSFALGAMGPANLCKMLQFLSEKGKIDADDAQPAVWCITSNAHLGSIGDETIRRYAAELTGKKTPGYHIKYEYKESPGAVASLGKAMTVESNFQYTLDKDDKLSLLLYDSENKLIKILRKDEPATAGEHRSGLHLQVWNLDSGTYTVRLVKKNGDIIKEMAIEF